MIATHLNLFSLFLFLLPSATKSGNAWAILADATRSHCTVLSTFVAAGVARGLVGLPFLKTFWPLLAAVSLSEAVAAPVIILADAATQSAQTGKPVAVDLEAAR